MHTALGSLVFYRVFALFGLFASFILLLLASLSTPIIKTLDFVHASDSALGQSISVSVGLWGACVSAKSQTCSTASVGFSSVIPSSLPGSQKLQQATSGGLANLLLLNAFAPVFALLSLAFAAPPKGTRATCAAAYWLSVLATLLSFLALLCDLIFFNGIRLLVDGATPLDATIGAGLYLVLVATILLALSSMALNKRQLAAKDIATSLPLMNAPMMSSKFGGIGKSAA